MGSNPAESRTQLLSLTGLFVPRKQTGSGNRPGCRGRRSPDYTAASSSSPGSPAGLFHFDSRAGVDELLLDGCGFVLADAFLYRLGSAIHQVLGFLQAQAGDFANRFDDVDLIGPGSDQDHI